MAKDEVHLGHPHRLAAVRGAARTHTGGQELGGAPLFSLLQVLERHLLMRNVHNGNVCQQNEGTEL